MTGPVFDPSVYEGMAPKLQARFFWKDNKNNAKTADSGRVITEPVLMIEFEVSEHHKQARKATEQDKLEYKPQYDAFMGKTEQPIVGTPLTECSVLTSKEVAMLRQVGLVAVEQLLSAPDTVLSRIPEAYRMQKTVRAWEAAAGKRALTAKLHKQIADQQDQIDYLKQQLEDMSERFCKATGEKYEPAAGAKTTKSKTKTKETEQ